MNTDEALDVFARVEIRENRHISMIDDIGLETCNLDPYVFGFDERRQVKLEVIRRILV